MLLRLAAPTFVQAAGKLREPGATSILPRLFTTIPINTTKMNKTLHLQAAKSPVGGHSDKDTEGQLLRESRTGHQFLQWFKHMQSQLSSAQHPAYKDTQKPAMPSELLTLTWPGRESIYSGAARFSTPRRRGSMHHGVTESHEACPGVKKGNGGKPQYEMETLGKDISTGLDFEGRQNHNGSTGAF